MEIRVPEIFKAALDFAFPQICPGCGEYSESDDILCERCLRSFSFLNGPICFKCRGLLKANSATPCCGKDSVPLILYAEYRTAMQESIVSLKFRGVRKLIPYFATAVADKWGETIKDCKADRLVPVRPGRR